MKPYTKYKKEKCKMCTKNAKIYVNVIVSSPVPIKCDENLSITFGEICRHTIKPNKNMTCLACIKCKQAYF